MLEVLQTGSAPLAYTEAQLETVCATTISEDAAGSFFGVLGRLSSFRRSSCPSWITACAHMRPFRRSRIALVSDRPWLIARASKW